VGSGKSNSVLVRVRDLRKRYAKVEAVRGVSFDIHQGEVFGLLGPNGAGKTTTIEILEGLRQADGGAVQVCGLDPARESAELKEKIGAQLQATVLPDKIRVEEAMRLFASFYRRHAPIDDLLTRFGLAEKRHTFFEHLSGGQKQRLALAMALLNRPELVLLDEPTVGLDAQLRREILDLIERLRADGATVLLTTHYIEEAERLCDRVAIMDRGQLVALGTPHELVSRSSHGTRLEARLAAPADPAQLQQLDAVHDCEEADGLYLLHVSSVAKALVGLIRHLESSGNTLLDLHIAQPSLEDVFVELTGHRLSD
jgi:ABC-2 type transport system ATP-binding protein